MFIPSICHAYPTYRSREVRKKWVFIPSICHAYPTQRNLVRTVRKVFIPSICHAYPTASSGVSHSWGCLFPQFVMLIQHFPDITEFYRGVYSLNLSCLSNHGEARSCRPCGVYSLNLSCLSNCHYLYTAGHPVFIPSICHAYPTTVGLQAQSLLVFIPSICHAYPTGDVSRYHLMKVFIPSICHAYPTKEMRTNWLPMVFIPSICHAYPTGHPWLRHLD